jgi:hypothetical protein
MVFDFNHHPIGRNGLYSSVYAVMRKPVLDDDGAVVDYKISKMKTPVCKKCAETCTAQQIYDRGILQSEENVVQYQADGFVPYVIERV